MMISIRHKIGGIGLIEECFSKTHFVHFMAKLS